MSDPELSAVLPDVATDTDVREQAYHLVYEQYLARGYTRSKKSGLWLSLYDGLEDTTTLVIEKENEVVRTLTLVPDGPMGLPADDLFRDLLDNLRAVGRLGEVSAFAVNPERGGRIDSAIALINAAALLGTRHGLTHFVITVNPRHVSFYRRGLGFQPVGEQRSYDKVDGAPARLLVADLKEAIRGLRMRPGRAGNLFNKFWTPDQSREIAVKLVGAHRPMSVEQLQHFYLVKTPLWHKASAEWQAALLGGRPAPPDFFTEKAPDDVIIAPPKNVIVAPPPPSTVLDRRTFNHLVGSAIRAPSADNMQPWAFGRFGDDVEIYYDRSRALKSDAQDLFGLFALGAAVEGLALEAGARGMASELLLDDERYVHMGDRERVARLRLSRHGQLDPLVRHLSGRRTDRRPYSLTGLTDLEIERLMRSVVGESTRFQLVREREKIEQAAKLAAFAERVRFETPTLYDELRAALRTKPGARTGIEVKRLGLPTGTSAILPWLGPWPRLRVLNTFGASLLAELFSKRQAEQSGAIGLMSLDLASDLGKLTGGRDLLRIWLAAQSLGLSVQPLGALPLLMAMAHEDGLLAPQHQARLSHAEIELEEIFPTKPGERPALLLRLGRPRTAVADGPSARLPPEDVVVRPDRDE